MGIPLYHLIGIKTAGKILSNQPAMLPTGFKRTSHTMLGVASVTRVESRFKDTQVDTELKLNLKQHIVQTEFGNISVYIQGDLNSKRDGVAFLTVHDIGSNHKPLARFALHAGFELWAVEHSFSPEVRAGDRTWGGSRG